MKPVREKTHRPFISSARLIAIIAAILLTAVSAILAFVHQDFFDERVFHALAPYVSDSVTPLMHNISFLGKHSFLIPVISLLVIYLLIIKDKWMALRVAAVMLSSLGVVSLLKRLIHRQRPPEPMVEGITNFSFPSGHSFIAMAFYGLLIWWANKEIRNITTRWMVISLLSVLIAMIGFSRVYLRVHYTTDVMAGFCIGIAWLLFALSVMDRIQHRRTTSSYNRT